MQGRRCLLPIHTRISNTFAVFQIVDLHTLAGLASMKPLQHQPDDTMIPPLYLRRNILQTRPLVDWVVLRLLAWLASIMMASGNDALRSMAQASSHREHIVIRLWATAQNEMAIGLPAVSTMADCPPLVTDKK